VAARWQGLVALAVLARPLAAQGPAVLAGTVTDAATAQPVAGATVLVSGTLARAVTDAAGRYRIAGLPAGVHTVTVAVIGYRRAVAGGVALAAGEERRLDFALARAAVEIPGVVVTASRATERPEDAPASVAVLAADAIRRRNVITLDQALPFVPGVVFNHGAMDIRGASGAAGGVGSRVLVLLDGHPVLTGDGAEIDFNALPILDVDRVEIVKGAYSALYGSNALGGVVNVITTPIGPAPETVAAAHFGFYDTPAAVRFTDRDRTFRGLDVQHSRRLGGLGARLLVARETSDGYEQNGWMSRWLLRTKLAWPAASPHAATAYALWSGEDDGEFFTWRSDAEPYAVDTAAAGDWSRSRKLLLGATLAPVATAGAVAQVSPYLFYNSIQNHFHDNRDYHRATRLGSTAQLAWSPRPAHTLTVGADAARTRVVSNILGEHAIWDVAWFAQDAVTLAPRWRGALGARLEYHDASGGRPESALSPKLGVSFRAAPAVSLRASVGRGYRAPSAIEQFVSAVQSGFRVVPNPALRGETAWSGEVGAAATVGGGLWLDGALFQSEYRDLIGPAPAPGQLLVFQFQNVQRARVRGLDLGAKLGVAGGRLGVEAAYTYLHATDLATGGPLPYRSRHNATLTIAGLGGLVALDARYRSRVDTVLAFPRDPRGPITVVDLRLGWRAFGLLLQAKVANLLQAAYVDVMERTRGAPRSVLVTAVRAP
jgi:iron complex outermembrane receptor protein